MVPYHGGALQPAEFRHSSITWRRFHKLQRARWLDLREKAELVAVMRMFGGPRRCRSVFEWDKASFRVANYLYLAKWLKPYADVYQAENDAAMDVETGEAMLSVLFEHGWQKYTPPMPALQALRQRRKEGWSVKALAEKWGIPPTRMQEWLTPRKPQANSRVAAAALLAVG